MGIHPSIWNQLFRNGCRRCEIDDVSHYLCTCFTQAIGYLWNGRHHNILLRILDEEIGMVQPTGFMRTGMKRNLVCWLLQSIYGLKQAAHIWNQKIRAFLIKIGFIWSNADPCLYIDMKPHIYITISVDNLLITRKNGWDIRDEGPRWTEALPRDDGHEQS